MERLHCSRCDRTLGWVIYCGPMGSVYCDECKEEHDRQEAEESEDKE